MLCSAWPCHVVLCQALSCCALFGPVMLCSARPCHVVLCLALSCCALPGPSCCAQLGLVMLCSARSCHVVLCLSFFMVRENALIILYPFFFVLMLFLWYLKVSISSYSSSHVTNGM
ncbi:hypothetical protein PoB_006637400 [Plakobranchus ocellatus]|uniref:Uncharacterized protein n=1 Tax=Plakobranchus ocellatus TaxID=259542 RepID=A0AAV4D6V7_9GAST|nr:hypothetical protein PoB_006637400 [Plakobranchus ocellatus]